jgi:ectoine hydroxylase-related dioxygenase (phytanoyl-CoA dioxygenase family)
MALTELSADEHAAAMADYVAERNLAASALGSRGPLRYDADGNLHSDILAEFETNGFYIFEGVVDSEEVAELRAAVEDTIERAPSPPESNTDSQGRPALGLDYPIRPYIFIKPLSDPWGGTELLSGRHPVKFTEPTPDGDAPDYVVHLILQMCTSMPAALRLYGHPELLRIAEAINGPDFVPYNDSIFVKKPGVGGSVAWHQDGATHWDNPDWYPGIHGFNFQVQLYDTTPANALWIVPGSHTEGRIDIRQRVAANEAGERLPDAIPLIANAGDVTIVNRQMLHGSFANTSPDPRVSITFGFYPQSSVLGVSGGLNITLDDNKSGKKVYDAQHIRRRSAVVQLAIDARNQARPDEDRYQYAPFAEVENEYRYGPETIANVLSDYTRYDIAI